MVDDVMCRLVKQRVDLLFIEALLKKKSCCLSFDVGGSWN